MEGARGARAPNLQLAELSQRLQVMVNANGGGVTDLAHRWQVPKATMYAWLAGNREPPAWVAHMLDLEAGKRKPILRE